jgi:hypothetical protein
MRTFTFDVKMFASLDIKAESESEAREKLVELLSGASANFGEPPYDEVILDTEDGGELTEIDGDPS